MKVGVVKDPHFMFGFKNNIRAPKWEQDILLKIEFIVDTLREKDIKYLLLTGDVFDKNKGSDWSFNLYITQYEFIKKYFHDKGIVLLSILGNHDMFNGYEGLEGTVFGKMVEDNLIEYLTDNPLILEDDSKKINIYGIDYSNNKDKILSKLNEINLLVDQVPGKENKKIVVLHSNVTPNNERVTDFTYEQLSNFSNIDMFILGHYHIGHEITRFNNTLFIDPWNLTRVVRDYDVKLNQHIPQLAILDFKNEDYQIIDIPHKPYSEAFKIEAIEIIEKTKEFRFFDEVDFNKLLEEGELTDSDIIKLLIQKEFDNKSDIEKKEIIELAQKYLIQ